MPVVDFLHQLHAAAVVEPGILLGSDHAERHGGEEHGVDVLALPVVGRRVAHFVLAGLDHVEHAEGRLVLVLGIDPDFHFAARHLLDHVGHVLHGITENREVGRPGHGQFPAVLGCGIGRADEADASKRKCYQQTNE